MFKRKNDKIWVLFLHLDVGDVIVEVTPIDYFLVKVNPSRKTSRAVYKPVPESHPWEDWSVLLNFRYDLFLLGSVHSSEAFSSIDYE